MQLATTAHHEAAHAVVSYILTGSAGVVSIVSDGDKLGGNKNQWSDSTCESDVESEILSLYAGGHAQRRIDPLSNDDGCYGDEEASAELLERWNWHHRESDFRQTSLDMVNEHWHKISVVADELLIFKILDDTEAAFIIDGDIESLTHYRRLIARV